MEFTPRQIEAFKALGNDYEGTPFDKIFESKYSGPSQVMNNLMFKFKIVNATGAAKKIALNAAMYNTLKIAASTTAAGSPLAYTTAITKTYNDLTEINAAGHGIDAVLDDGEVIPGLTCTAARKKIRDFMNFIKNNTVFVPEIIMTADDPAAWDGELVIKNVSPFREMGDSAIISLQDSYSEFQQQNKKITLKLAQDGNLVFFDDQTLIYLNIPSGRTIDITLRCGMINNPSADFANKVLSGLGM